MRTEIQVHCPFNRDTSWITQEVIEDYAGACLMGGNAPDFCARKWSAGDVIRAQMLPELLLTHPDFRHLKQDLKDEFGEEYFIGPSESKEFHIRQLEMRIENCQDNEVAAKLYKVYMELRGWAFKPMEKSLEVTLNTLIATGKTDQFAQFDNKQLEQRYYSLIGG